MAPPQKIEQYLAKYIPETRRSNDVAYRIPTFFERKRVEEEMKAARRKAEESDRMKSEFLANMSHEIRTPMNAVIGMTELVLDTPLDDVQREYLNTTLESAESLMTIINQILDFSKIEAGKLELDANPFSLRDCVGDTMKSLAIRAQSKGLELAWRVATDVPDALQGDAGRLRQIFINLVGNAIKFTDEGEIVAEIGMQETSDDRATLHVQIRDSGIGIPADKLETIFHAFTQVDMATTRRYGGTGLGLTISGELVRLMGGKIWVESQPGQGSTFHFTAQFELDDATVSQHDDLADLSVLVVADKANNRKILEETFRTVNMRVGSVDSVPAALHGLLKQQQAGHPLHLLVTDIANGVSLVESIRENDDLVDPMIITLTSSNRRGELHRFETLGVDACLIKPVKQSELVTAIIDAKQRREMKVHAASGAHAGVAESARSLSAPAKEPGTGIRILLVEDGVANQKFAVAMLSRWGHTVAIANNGKEAISKLRAAPHDFDLVLMDVLMPEMDGLQATAAIRELERTSGGHIPIVAITAQAMKGDREKCLEAGMDDYLSKPIRRRELQDTIERLIS